MVKSAETVAGLAALVGGRHTGDGSVTITDATHDSRRVDPGSLFIALRGGSYDGHEFISDALASGAAAICVEEPANTSVPEIIVDNTRSVAGPLASRIHRDPSHHLAVIGVTGTNGKTTVTHFIESIAVTAGLRAGLVGTISTRIAGDSHPSTLTTPEATDFQRMLAAMVASGVQIVATEVSSHGLDLQRVKATRFKVAAFTNLSQDHLDFHGDMESYRTAKERLFSEYDVETAVFNIDDLVGAELASGYEGRALTVGRGGDISIHDFERYRGGTRLRIETPDGGMNVPVPVVGDFNLSNLAMAVACCLAAGLEFSRISEAIPHLTGVPGRFEVVSGNDDITVIVDYAHTPEAVQRAVEVAGELTNGRVIAMLGAGGDRDRAKRPAMGAALSTASLAIITSDNPRSEDPSDVVAAVLAGVEESRPHRVEVDRRTAIDLAIDSAEDGDVVLILGRGHEAFQQVGTDMIPFDDREVAASSLRRRRSTESDPGSGSMTR